MVSKKRVNFLGNKTSRPYSSNWKDNLSMHALNFLKN